MGDIVNLRNARKRAERQRAERTASANRLLHGRSKAERELERKVKPTATSTATGSKQETSDEISGR